MTAMTTNTRELDINTLVLTAYQYAGVMNELQTAQGPQWDARSAYGRRQLELIIDGLAALGIFERAMQFSTLSVASGDVTTELPADTVDIRGEIMLEQEDGTQFKLSTITREGYQDITLKEQSGMPIKVYVARGAPMQLYLWPVPDAACTLLLQRQVLSFDNSAGSATPDLERYWADYLVHELAHRVAMSSGISMDRCAMLMSKAAECRRNAQGKASSQLPNRIVVNHRGPYR